MNLFVKCLLILNKNISKVKYYILFSSALFILVFFFDSKSSKSESHLNMSDGHLSIEIGDIENIATVDQQSSKELLNDIICDNIVLKNKLDKVVGETKTLRESLEEIGSRVKEINDVCDILVSEKLKSDGNSCVKSNRSQNSTSKVKRVFV